MNVNRSDNDVTVTQPAYVPDSTIKTLLLPANKVVGR